MHPKIGVVSICIGLLTTAILAVLVNGQLFVVDPAGGKVRGKYQKTSSCMRSLLAIDRCSMCTCLDHGRGWYCAVSGNKHCEGDWFSKLGSWPEDEDMAVNSGNGRNGGLDGSAMHRAIQPHQYRSEGRPEQKKMFGPAGKSVVKKPKKRKRDMDKDSNEKTGPKRKSAKMFLVHPFAKFKNLGKSVAVMFICQYLQQLVQLLDDAARAQPETPKFSLRVNMTQIKITL